MAPIVWNVDATQRLIQAYGSVLAEATASGRTNMSAELWSRVAVLLRVGGLERTSTQCENKVGKLRKIYRAEFSNPSLPPWQYMAAMTAALHPPPAQAVIGIGEGAAENDPLLMPDQIIVPLNEVDDAGAIGDGAIGDVAIGDGAIGDGAIGDAAIGDGAIGDAVVALNQADHHDPPPQVDEDQQGLLGDDVRNQKGLLGAFAEMSHVDSIKFIHQKFIKGELSFDEAYFQIRGLKPDQIHTLLVLCFKKKFPIESTAMKISQLS